ncbi:phage tail protein [Rodentibacter ratti]|uniref:phage tail protein n=1 Tax=Rodentibacter ratti TaxID=1906745 RepID=UPI002117EAB4
MTGNLTIDTADSLLKGKRNGTNKYAVGLRNSSSDDAVFINYTYDTVLELLRDAIRSNKTLIAAGMTIENSDYAGVSLKNLSNRYIRIEGNPHSAADMLTFVYREANGSNINVVGLPRKNGTLLLDNDLVGEVGFFARATPPSGWLKANGAAVSRTTYAALFAAIGTTFGAGDGRTTFNLPDLRGEFLRGLDDGRNIDSNRRLGSWQKGTIEGFDGLDATSVFGVGLVRDGAYNTLTLEESVTLVGADHTTYDDVREIALKWAGGGGARATNNSADREGGFWTKNNKNPVKSSHFAGMTRPRNIALLACIKY